LEDTGVNNDLLIWCCLVGGAAPDIVKGIQRLLLSERSDPESCTGSKSKVRFKLRVAPQAIDLKAN